MFFALKLSKYFIKVECDLFEVRHTNFETHIVGLVPVVNKFLEVSPNDLLGLLPEREIDFGIKLLQDI